MERTTAGQHDAAVVLGFRRNRDGELMLVMIERATGGRHGGQLSLPGGNIEAIDADLRATAVRETCEEIGTFTQQVRILDALDPVATRTTGYRVWPFVARFEVPTDHEWKPQTEEVAAVVELPVRRLADTSARGSDEFSFPGWDAPRQMPTRSVDGRVLWGLTLRLVEPYLGAALTGRWKL